ncbi:MAG: STAS/SEC14 domain-containing protein [Burkholderiales bacterium]
MAVEAYMQGMSRASSVATVQAPHGPMRYEIVAEPQFVRATLFNRRTAAETREFLTALAAECIRLQRFNVLVSVRASKPIFTLERYGFSAFIQLALKHSAKVAALTDNAEQRVAHEYAVMLARLRGVNVRTFRDEAAAIAWLENGKR